MFKEGQRVRIVIAEELLKRDLAGWHYYHGREGTIVAVRGTMRDSKGPDQLYAVRIAGREKNAVLGSRHLVPIIEVETRKPAFQHELPESRYEGVTAKKVKRSRRRHKVTISAVTKRDAERSREAIRALLYPYGKEA